MDPNEYAVHAEDAIRAVLARDGVAGKAAACIRVTEIAVEAGLDGRATVSGRWASFTFALLDPDALAGCDPVSLAEGAFESMVNSREAEWALHTSMSGIDLAWPLQVALTAGIEAARAAAVAQFPAWNDSVRTGPRASLPPRREEPSRNLRGDFTFVVVDNGWGPGCRVNIENGDRHRA